MGSSNSEYKYNLLGLRKVSKNTPWWELCTHIDRKILFQSLECAKDKKYHLPVSIKVGFFHAGYQNDQHLPRNIFHPTFKKGPSNESH